MIGKIQRVSLREVWKHEALYFTTWLTEHIDVLSDVLDLSLSNAEREQAAGSFSVDILAEDESGNPVIIENQLERSDHDHLGKLITYLTAYSAKTAVWITSDPRPEHVRAVSWLNESTDASFYLLKVEAIRIGESAAAPLLTVIVGPSQESREVGEVKRDLADRHHIRHQFWTKLLDYAKSKTRLHHNISPGHKGWVQTTAGRTGLSYNYVVNQYETRVELYIKTGKDDASGSKAIFDQLEAHKEQIEKVFGEPLEWEPLEERRACKIAKRLKIGGYRNQELYPHIFEATVDARIRLERALRPFI